MSVERAIAEEVVKILEERGMLGQPRGGKKLFTVAEVAEMLGSSHTHVRGLIVRYKVPIVKWDDNGHTYIEAAEVDKLIAKNRKEPDAA